MKLRSLLFASAVLVSTNAFAYRTAAWIPSWDANALTSIQMHAGSLDESNPVWYSLSSNGSIVVNWNAENPTWLAAMTGTQIMPTLQNVVSGSFNASVVNTLIATDSSRNAHAQAITDLVLAKAYDGIDIDYERIPTASRANFTAFAQVLAAKLHAAGKKLSITVYAKTSDAQNWDGPGSQDWPALGAVADSIKIMAYDYHWSTSAAGAITPLTWLDQVVTYAEQAIPAAKIIVGLPWYGYDWQGSNGAGVVYDQAMSLATANNATITRDANGEATFNYGDHTVYFQDATAYQRKTDLIRQNHPNVGGFTTWRVGGEDPGFWTVMNSLRTSTPPPPVPASFTVSGPTAMTVRVNKTATASYAITRTGGFADPIVATVEKLSPFDATVSISSTTLKVVTTRTTPEGTYQLRVRFVGGGITQDVMVAVTVTKH